MMTSETRPRRSARVLSQQAADTTVLLDPESGEYFALEGVGARIWELCDGGASAEQIAQVVSVEWEQQLIAVREDVLELLNDLASSALIESTP